MDPKTLTMRDLDTIARERGQMGKVATAKGLLDHREAAFEGKGSKQKLRQEYVTEQEMRRVLEADLPPIIRRTPRERYLALLQRLRTEAEKSVQLHGRVIWPASLQAELTALGWRAGNPDLAGQVEALARRMFEKAAHQQADSDRSKVTRDWHGHDNTSITISSAPKGGTEGKD